MAIEPTLTVGTGSFCLIDLTEPYELIHGDGLRTIGLELPRVLLESCLPHAIGYAGAVVRQDSGASRVLGGLLRSLGSELTGEGSASALPPMLARSIAGFVAAAFADRPDASLLRGNADRLVGIPRLRGRVPGRWRLPPGGCGAPVQCQRTLCAHGVPVCRRVDVGASCCAAGWSAPRNCCATSSTPGGPLPISRWSAVSTAPHTSARVSGSALAMTPSQFRAAGLLQRLGSGS